MISTTARSFQSEASLCVSRPILLPTSCRGREMGVSQSLGPHPQARTSSQPSWMALITSRMLYRWTSQKSRTPISVPMYHPLKGHPGNSRPPTSSSMLATAGRAYHLSSSSRNHSYLAGRQGWWQWRLHCGPRSPLIKASEKQSTKKTPFQVLISKFIPPGEVNWTYMCHNYTFIHELFQAIILSIK